MKFPHNSSELQLLGLIFSPLFMFALSEEQPAPARIQLLVDQSSEVSCHGCCRPGSDPDCPDQTPFQASGPKWKNGRRIDFGPTGFLVIRKKVQNFGQKVGKKYFFSAPKPILDLLSGFPENPTSDLFCTYFNCFGAFGLPQILPFFHTFLGQFSSFSAIFPLFPVGPKSIFRPFFFSHFGPEA